MQDTTQEINKENEISPLAWKYFYIKSLETRFAARIQKILYGSLCEPDLVFDPLGFAVQTAKKPKELL